VVRVLAAADPANPYGAALPWPKRDEQQKRALQRAAGAYVVLVDGEPLLYVERGGRSLVTLPAFDGERASLAVAALVSLPGANSGRALSFERVDGVPSADSPHAGLFRDAGFVSGYRGMTYRAPRTGALANAGGR
jgi:ATP-dependent helicase Lhr and Lhr-like helicase